MFDPTITIVSTITCTGHIYLYFKTISSLMYDAKKSNNFYKTSL